MTQTNGTIWPIADIPLSACDHQKLTQQWTPLAEPSFIAGPLQGNLSFGGLTTLDVYLHWIIEMRPWQHSFASSAQTPAAMDSLRTDPRWRDFLDLHEFLDLSKAGCADRRHRIMLHHCDMGAAIAERAFPRLANCRTLVRQHVEEDLGFYAELSHWLAGLDCDRLPKPVLRRTELGPEAVAELVLNRVTGAKALDGSTRRFQEEAARDVAQFLWMPLTFEGRAPISILSILMNSVGPLLVRRVFGPPQICTDAGRTIAVDYAWLAEAVIMACFGRIPDLAEVVRCVDAEPARRAKAS